MRYLINLSYDGFLFYGSQVQKNKRTVCGVLNNNISKILNENIKVVACSRTDKGVHARDYYVHFDTIKSIDLNKFKRSLNSLIDKDIYIRKVIKVSDEFHARFNVLNKEYKYLINIGEYNPIDRNYVLDYNRRINVKLLKKASRLLIGTHDFRSFTSDKDKLNYVRTINYIKIKKDGDIVSIYINADGFLRYMVRNIVGLLLDINEGKKKLDDIKEIMDSKDRRKLGMKVNSEGLYLNKVNY